ncbi:hypothetical protein AJ85_05215 [Alkalihalobacillus alcalophilus ATCC 27647 = CGMCC 1.3604]|uniref:Flagellar Assembly Protein A N-terminal region domain-containing protein n=1 Tax=Alkalihalobacillus alcalophilus ATCC 27647 = CGMCC 1.3604 TaxID=1218173 RepID=A0A094WN16_ALKAL|nr:FapA family protein [Alkalihalobacillus alcalophilus]KGA98226.1 hypothetical protein BALCAV_0205540 [Alkalihalobacillus alcalophilus ATCC 27647 = CGMCC 1.3604]MED1562166.1 FapA family protein [Alkalihalobacillus alcalophilus]THG91391.1 hypothetical protein AJ85_05215 [Alkalihalobacillus alcalophilus ATCC 27647 = CGMCC 1.3604]
MSLHALEPYFSVKVNPNKMEAYLHQKEPIGKSETVNKENLNDFLLKKRVQFGIDKQVIEYVIENQMNDFEPQLIAKGQEPTDGKDAYLSLFLNPKKEQSVETNQDMHTVDLKDVLEIPAVEAGAKLAQKIAATKGTDGINVYGDKVQAKRGKDFQLRTGKNTRLEENTQTLFSIVDGQVSFTKKTVHVYPVYEVKGDVGTKTGNIHFIGNVHIRGSVPTGFKITAGGDIRISGTIEGAELVAGGSIYVGAGIVGQKKSQIKAKGSLHTTFINEGNIEVEDSIYVTQSILHSYCYAFSEIVCIKGKGNIVGGSTSAGFKIHANEFGNAMHTKTELYVGPSEKAVKQQKEMELFIKETNENINKSSKLLKMLVEKEKRSGALQGKEKLHKLKVLHFLKESMTKRDQQEENLLELKENIQGQIFGYIKCEKMIYPNVNVHFGKYRRKLSSSYPKTQIALMENEITISMLK